MIFTGFICFLCVFMFVVGSVGFTKRPSTETRTFLVSYKGRLWWVGQSGRLLEVAKAEDVLSKAYVNNVEVKDGYVEHNIIQLLEKLRPILDSPYIVEVIPKERRVVLLKGVSLRFNEWSDLLRNVQVLPEVVKKMEPKGEYFLSPQGLFYKLRGGDDEKR